MSRAGYWIFNALLWLNCGAPARAEEERAMGKRSQARERWPKRKRDEHVFSNVVTDNFGRLIRILSRGLTRPERAELEKRVRGER